MFSKMQLQYTIILVILLGGHFCASVETTTTLRPTFHITDKVCTCSYFLSQLIQRICNNRYNIVKREISPLLDALTPEDMQINVRESAFNSEKRRRLRRQVANECCLKQCTVADVLSYCDEDSPVLVENPDLLELFRKK